MSLRWERRTETPSGAVCARAEKTPQGLKSDAPGADASPGPTSKECSSTKETSSAPRLPSPLAVATPVPAPAGVSGSVARAPVALRDDAGGSKSSSAAAAKPAVASSARRSSVRVAVLLRGIGGQIWGQRRSFEVFGGGGARSEARGGRIDARGGVWARSESTRGVDIGSGAHLMTRVTRVPVTQSGLEPGHLLKHLFLSARSKITLYGRAH